MGGKEKWFGAVKKVLMPNCCQGDHSEALSKHSDPLPVEEVEASAKVVPQPLPASVEEIKLPENVDGQNNHAFSVAIASAVAAEAAAVAAQAAAEVVRLTTSTTRSTAESREEIAAVKIQTAYRGYLSLMKPMLKQFVSKALDAEIERKISGSTQQAPPFLIERTFAARKRLRTLAGLVRLRRLLDGNAVKSQTANTLQCMQTLARLQTQIRSRRIRMTEENHALQRHLQRKRERELNKVKIEEEWDDTPQSKEQIEANLLNKHEAAIRRERALAYAFSHQWKSTSRSLTPQPTDLSNPQWGWSWLDRWMAARPWENENTKEINDHASIKSASQSLTLRTAKRRDVSSERTPPAVQKSGSTRSRQSPVTPRSRAPAPIRKKSVSPRGGRISVDDDSRSMLSIQSEGRIRRHSIAGSSTRDDASHVSSPTAVPSYMASTEAARARSRFHSSLSDKAESPETSSICSVKKRLSFPLADDNSTSDPANIRRHSEPPKVDIFPAMAVAIDETTNN